jgi:hypothetical protein
MSLLLHPPREPDALLDDTVLPAEVSIILSALEIGSARIVGDLKIDKRRTPRKSHHARAEVRLFSDSQFAGPWIVYTRDIDAGHIGFLSDRWLPLGQSGRVRWKDFRGEIREASCTVSRSRETVRNWFEGALALHIDE